MAKLNAEYFSHDTDASQDEKIIYLESLFGDSGYTWFFKMLETLGRADNFEIEWNELKCAVLARKFNTTQQEFNKFIVAATKQEVRAFVIENGVLFSPGLKKRLGKLVDRRKKEADRIAKKRANDGVAPTNSDVAATKTQSKVKESKEEYNNTVVNARAKTDFKKIHRDQVSEWVEELAEDEYTRECFTRSRKIPEKKYDEYFAAFKTEAKARPGEYNRIGDVTQHFLNFSGRRYEAEQRAKSGPKKGSATGRATINNIGGEGTDYTAEQAF